MNRYLGIIGKSTIFNGIATAELLSMLKCLSSGLQNYSKNEVVLMVDEKPKHIGVVIFGQLHVTKIDLDGKRTIVDTLAPSDIYGEALVCAGIEKSPVTVFATEDSTVLLLNFDCILKVCSNTCTFHAKLIENMMFLLAKKNVFLQNRIEIISNKSVRIKIMTYLNSFAPLKGKTIRIPLNRAQMSEYLCVERSALSHELMKMKQDKLLDYHKNEFTLF